MFHVKHVEYEIIQTNILGYATNIVNLTLTNQLYGYATSIVNPIQSPNTAPLPSVYRLPYQGYQTLLIAALAIPLIQLTLYNP